MTKQTRGRSRRAWIAAAVLSAPWLQASAHAERTQVYSIQDARGDGWDAAARSELGRIEGVRTVEVDRARAELKLRVAAAVPDAVVLAALERAGLKALVGPGRGTRRTAPEYPAGTDLAYLSRDGSAVGPLESRRVRGKYTIFDLYADWCAPCRLVDERLRAIAAARGDVAIRKLNVVSFESPLALEMGPDFEVLPYLVVFSPDGKRTDIEGTDFRKLEQALAKP